MKVIILGIRGISVDNVIVKRLETGIRLIKDGNESVYIPNHNISSYYIANDEISVAVKMTKKQFALLESFILNIGGVYQ